jgi:hypothetical protein
MDTNTSLWRLQFSPAPSGHGRNGFPQGSVFHRTSYHPAVIKKTPNTVFLDQLQIRNSMARGTQTKIGETLPLPGGVAIHHPCVEIPRLGRCGSPACRWAPVAVDHLQQDGGGGVELGPMCNRCPAFRDCEGIPCRWRYSNVRAHPVMHMVHLGPDRRLYRGNYLPGPHPAYNRRNDDSSAKCGHSDLVKCELTIPEAKCPFRVEASMR